MLCIVSCELQTPQVLFEGLFAVGQILLCEVGLLVGGEGGEVRPTRLNGAADLGKTLTLGEFVTSDRSRTLAVTLAVGVRTLAIRTGRLRLAVGRQQVLAVAVLVALARTLQQTTGGLEHRV